MKGIALVCLFQQIWGTRKFTVPLIRVNIVNPKRAFFNNLLVIHNTKTRSRASWHFQIIMRPENIPSSYHKNLSRLNNPKKATRSNSEQNYKSSPLEVLRKGVLKTCSKFTVSSNFIEIAFLQGCSPLNLLHIFRTTFLRKTS